MRDMLVFILAVLFSAVLATPVAGATAVAEEELAAALSEAKMVYDGEYTLYKSTRGKRLHMWLGVEDIDGKCVVVVETGRVNPLAGRYPEVRVCGDACSEWVEVYPYRLHEFVVPSISDRIIVEMKDWGVPVANDHSYSVDIRRIWVAPYKPDTITVTVTVTAEGQQPVDHVVHAQPMVLMPSSEKESSLLLAGVALAVIIAVVVAIFAVVGARRG